VIVWVSSVYLKKESLKKDLWKAATQYWWEANVNPAAKSTSQRKESAPSV
jgi:hypothetical protein